MASRVLFLFVLVALAVGSQAGGRPLVDPTVGSKPWWFETAKMARWLVHNNIWTNVATTSIHLNGTAFGNIQSFCDGNATTSTGRLFFYGSTLDPTWTDVTQGSAKASVNLVEKQIAGYCAHLDAESPLCAKVTLTGTMKPVPATDPDYASIKGYLFGVHPSMADWPPSHNFQFFELHIQEIFFLDMFGGAKHVKVQDYMAAQVSATWQEEYRAFLRAELARAAKWLPLPSPRRPAPAISTIHQPRQVPGSVDPSPALAARTLVHANNYTSMSTTSVHLNGTAFGQVQSYTDGDSSVSTGRLLFYGSTDDPSFSDTAVNPACSVTIVQAQEAGGNGCLPAAGLDPESPMCAKVTFSGDMTALPPGPARDQAKQWLFAVHPSMKTWPDDHHFNVYELKIRTIFFLNHFGGAVPISIDDYFKADPLANERTWSL